ncbi:MAG: hypothetical protein J6T08_01575 [Lentisphaeria bacterium]|nr:hypothetical protein [Lentisphaeria bacterium]
MRSTCAPRRFRENLGKITLNICNSLKPCYCIVTELENSPNSGGCHRQGSNFHKYFGLGEDCTRKEQCATVGAFSTSTSPFSFLRENRYENTINNL